VPSPRSVFEATEALEATPAGSQLFHTRAAQSGKPRGHINSLPGEGPRSLVGFVVAPITYAARSSMEGQRNSREHLGTDRTMGRLKPKGPRRGGRRRRSLAPSRLHPGQPGFVCGPRADPARARCRRRCTPVRANVSLR